MNDSFMKTLALAGGPAAQWIASMLLNATPALCMWSLHVLPLLSGFSPAHFGFVSQAEKKGQVDLFL